MAEAGAAGPEGLRGVASPDYRLPIGPIAVGRPRGAKARCAPCHLCSQVRLQHITLPGIHKVYGVQEGDVLYPQLGAQVAGEHITKMNIFLVVSYWRIGVFG